MVYAVAIVGFVLGFALGLFVLSIKLKDKTNEELLKNKNLWWAYGTLNWIIAIICSISSVYLYKHILG